MKKISKLLIIVISLFVIIGIPNVYADDSNCNSNHNADFMVVEGRVMCGVKGDIGLLNHIPSILPRMTRDIYNGFMVVVPVIMIIMGTVDLVKGVMTGKEDEMKKGRETFIKRLITGVLVFILVLIAKFAVTVVSGSGNSTRIIDCIDCFVSNKCTIEKKQSGC